MSGDDGWQPIETAPRDGTVVWVFNGEQACMWWDHVCGLWLWSEVLLSDVDPEPDQPTHWRPLPAPPQEAGDDR
jgi:hypothetical protein